MELFSLCKSRETASKEDDRGSLDTASPKFQSINEQMSPITP